MSLCFRFLYYFLIKKSKKIIFLNEGFLQLTCFNKKNKKFFIKTLLGVVGNEKRYVISVPDDHAVVFSEMIHGDITRPECERLFRHICTKNNMESSSTWTAYHCLKLNRKTFFSVVNIGEHMFNQVGWDEFNIKKLIHVDIPVFSILRFFMFTEQFRENMVLVSVQENAMAIYSFAESAWASQSKVHGPFKHGITMGLQELIDQSHVLSQSSHDRVVYLLTSNQMKGCEESLSEILNSAVTTVSIWDYVDDSVSDFDRDMVDKYPLQMLIAMGMSLWRP